jgi:hypothetical protein
VDAQNGESESVNGNALQENGFEYSLIVALQDIAAAIREQTEALYAMGETTDEEGEPATYMDGTPKRA